MPENKTEVSQSEKRTCTEDRRNNAGYFGVGHNA